MTESTGILTYDTNNSGGRWWLTDQDWEKLATAGWIVHWVHDPKQVHPDNIPDPTDKDDPHNWDNNFGGHTHQYSEGYRLVPAIREGDWLGAGAKSASKRFVHPDDGVQEWESLTGQDSHTQGCISCGPPHSFSWEPDDGKYRHSWSNYIDYEEDDY
jgi:hypothetical protein